MWIEREALYQQIALKELQMEHLFVIYPGLKAFPLQENMTAVPLSQIEHCNEVMSSRGAT